MNKFSNNVILASSSPRRMEILADMGVKYEVIPANIDESEIKSRFPFLLVEKLAKAKAEHIACEHRSDTVIAADTIVVLDGKVYGKPHDRARAFDMIKKAQRTHACRIYGRLRDVRGQKSCGLRKVARHFQNPHG